jgi:hypothetical protein
LCSKALQHNLFRDLPQSGTALDSSITVEREIPMMRKSLWIVPLLLLFAAIGSTTAHADTLFTYTYSFTGTNGTSFSFTTDPLSVAALGPEIPASDLAAFSLGSAYSSCTLSDFQLDNGPVTASITIQGSSCNLGNPAAVGVVDGTITNADFSTPGTYGFEGLSPLGPGADSLTVTAVPEIDPQNATSALALLIGAILVIRGCRPMPTPRREREEFL